jgi:hypothetical protein
MSFESFLGLLVNETLVVKGESVRLGDIIKDSEMGPKMDYFQKKMVAAKILQLYQIDLSTLFRRVPRNHGLNSIYKKRLEEQLPDNPHIHLHTVLIPFSVYNLNGASMDTFYDDISDVYSIDESAIAESVHLADCMIDEIRKNRRTMRKLQTVYNSRDEKWETISGEHPLSTWDFTGCSNELDWQSYYYTAGDVLSRIFVLVDRLLELNTSIETMYVAKIGDCDDLVKKWNWLEINLNQLFKDDILTAVSYSKDITEHNFLDLLGLYQQCNPSLGKMFSAYFQNRGNTDRWQQFCFSMDYIMYVSGWTCPKNFAYVMLEMQQTLKKQLLFKCQPKFRESDLAQFKKSSTVTRSSARKRRIPQNDHAVPGLSE